MNEIIWKTEPGPSTRATAHFIDTRISLAFRAYVSGY